ncbi:5707_t:CDS:1, partial [Dentiscutata erythropus]
MPEITFEIRKIRVDDFLHKENRKNLARYFVEPFYYRTGNIRNGEIHKIHRLFIQFNDLDEMVEGFRWGNTITLKIDLDLADTSLTRLNKFHISSDQYGREVSEIRIGNIEEYMEGE